MTTVTIDDDLVLDAVSTSDAGGWDAPSKKTDENFSFDSYAGDEPIELTIEAWVSSDEYDDLEQYRSRTQPFPASVGHLTLSKAKLDNLEATNEPVPEEHVRVSITLSEVQQATDETAEVSFDIGGDQSHASSSEDTNASNSQTSDEDGGDIEDETGGIAESISDVTDSIAGAVFG